MRTSVLLPSALFALQPAVARSIGNVLMPRFGGPCTDVHIFLARGNNEPYPGRQGKLVTAICDGLSSCDYEDILYTNPLEAPYCQSIIDGQAHGMRQVTEYNTRCPNSKLVVSGYSQGAHVVGDMLGGGGGVFFQDCVQPDSPGLEITVNPTTNSTTTPGDKIIAALMFASTRHTAGQPYNTLTGTENNGLFPRPATQLDNLVKYGDRLRDFCVATDPVCAGGADVETHLNYFDVFTTEAAAWVKERIQQSA